MIKKIYTIEIKATNVGEGETSIWTKFYACEKCIEWILYTKGYIMPENLRKLPILPDVPKCDWCLKTGTGARANYYLFDDEVLCDTDIRSR